MKKEKYRGVNITLLVVEFLLLFGFLLLVMWVGSKGGFVSDEETEQIEETAEPLNITIPTPTTEGTLTVYDEHGEVYFQYSGEINILNSGQNGEPVEVEVKVPVIRCSCFGEEGRLKE